jgi:hypothetical protein
MIYKSDLLPGGSGLQRELQTAVCTIPWLTKAVKPAMLLRFHDSPSALQMLCVSKGLSRDPGLAVSLQGSRISGTRSQGSKRQGSRPAKVHV